METGMQTGMVARADAWAQMHGEERAFLARRTVHTFLGWLRERNQRLDAAVAAGALDPWGEQDEEGEGEPFPQGRTLSWAEVNAGHQRNRTAERLYGWLCACEVWVSVADIRAGTGMTEDAVRSSLRSLERRDAVVLEGGYGTTGQQVRYAAARRRVV